MLIEVLALAINCPCPYLTLPLPCVYAFQKLLHEKKGLRERYHTRYISTSVDIMMNDHGHLNKDV